MSRRIARALSLALVLAVVPTSPAARAQAPERSEAAPEPTHEQIADAIGTPFPRAAELFDAVTGEPIFSFHGDRKLPPASLLKMATALVVSRLLKPDDVVTISERAANARADRLQWRIGARFTVEQVMYGMMLESSNGAAIALAERAAGSVKGFAGAANATLRTMGITNTKLVDPSGLDSRGQVSTAHDLALMAREVLADRWLSKIVRARSYTLPWPDSGSATFRNINRYVSDDPTAVGVKNGYTSQAGNTLVAASRRGGRTLIAVVLDGPAIYDTAARMIDLGFDLLGIAKPKRARIADADRAAPPTDASVDEPLATEVEPVAEEQAAVTTTAAREATGGLGGMVRLMLVLTVFVWWVALLVENAMNKRRRQLRRRLHQRLAEVHGLPAPAVHQAADRPARRARVSSDR